MCVSKSSVKFSTGTQKSQTKHISSTYLHVFSTLRPNTVLHCSYWRPLRPLVTKIRHEKPNHVHFPSLCHNSDPIYRAQQCVCIAGLVTLPINHNRRHLNFIEMKNTQISFRQIQIKWQNLNLYIVGLSRQHVVASLCNALFIYVCLIMGEDACTYCTLLSKTHWQHWLLCKTSVRFKLTLL